MGKSVYLKMDSLDLKVVNTISDLEKIRSEYEFLMDKVEDAHNLINDVVKDIESGKLDWDITAKKLKEIASMLA
jgi:hypothetical protein